MATSKITRENNFISFSTPPLKGCCRHARPCLITATEILSSFITEVTSISCLSKNKKNIELLSSSSSSSCRSLETSVTSDNLLKNMREAENFLRLSLDCPCSLRPRVQLILVNICHKLLAWSQAFVPRNCEQEEKEDHNLSLQIMSQVSCEKFPRENIIHQPLTIGEHCIDLSLQAEVKARVVLNELQRLETIIHALTSRIMEELYISSTEKDNFVSNYELVLSEDMRSKLSTFLIQRLQSTKSVLIYTWMGNL